MASKESKNKNVVVASDDTRSSQEEEQKQNKTKTDLGISLDKLTLGPKKKLLIIPLAGIIVYRAHVRSPATIPKNRRPDFSYGNFLIYKRPYCEGFLKFCFERFEVGLWSSAMERNIEKVLTHILGEMKNKFLFTWSADVKKQTVVFLQHAEVWSTSSTAEDQNQCTNTGFMCLDNENKPVFLKELKCVWEKYSSEKYSSSNTLLITDPEKALLNPPNTGIFPKKYDIDNEDIGFLGPKGEFRLFLDGLAEAKDVQSYVKDHPFGEPAITPSHPDWNYYSKIIRFFEKKKTTDQKKN